MNAHSELLILGNGGAACNAAMSARTAGFDGPIRMLSDLDTAAFNPMLGPYYLKGRLDWTGCFPFGTDFYRRWNIDRRFGSPVTALDAENRQAMCADGSVWTYDRCLIATGASPTFPPVPGLAASAHAVPVRNADSVLKLEKAMRSVKKIVVLGASLVGIKMAEIMTAHQAEVLLVDVTPQVMARGAHPLTASHLQAYLERMGVTVMLGCSLRGLEDDGQAVCCFFPERLMEKADCIAVCTGIRPNLDFIDRRQVAVDQAVLIDTASRTNIEGLFAAGDCAQGINPITGRPEWQGTWGNACYQGRVAGWRMAGKKAVFPGHLPQHISPFFDWTYVQIGDVTPTGKEVRVETTGDPKTGSFRLLVYENEVLVGANLINDPDGVAPIRRALLGLRTDLFDDRIHNRSADAFPARSLKQRRSPRGDFA
jgi:NADPH-dependent 2,4-dienoyl-CoA reductase/sulfur reductase-like enzyme